MTKRTQTLDILGYSFVGMNYAEQVRAAAEVGISEDVVTAAQDQQLELYDQLIMAKEVVSTIRSSPPATSESEKIKKNNIFFTQMVLVKMI